MSNKILSAFAIVTVIGFSAALLPRLAAPDDTYISDNYKPVSNPNLALNEMWQFSDSFVNDYGKVYRITDSVPEGRYILSFYVSRSSNLSVSAVQSGYPYYSAGCWSLTYYRNLSPNLRPSSNGFCSVVFDFSYSLASDHYIYFNPCGYSGKFNCTFTVYDLTLIRLGDISNSKGLESYEYIPDKDAEIYIPDFKNNEVAAKFDSSGNNESLPKSNIDFSAQIAEEPKEIEEQKNIESEVVENVE